MLLSFSIGGGRSPLFCLLSFGPADMLFHVMLKSICDCCFRGTCQPYCRSLPDDPLLECFESTDGSNIQGISVTFPHSVVENLFTWGSC